MKVLVLTHTFPRYLKDITSAFMKYFCDGLVDAGNEVHVLTPHDEDFRWRGGKFGVSTYKYIWPDSLHSMGYSRNMVADVSMKAWSYLLIPFMVFFGTIALAREVRKHKIDVINVHWILPNGLMALIVSKLLSIPYVVTLPGTDVFISRQNVVFGFVARAIANNASVITSNSSGLVNSFKKVGGIARKSTEIITYPTDISHLKPSKKGVEPLRRKLGFKKSDVVVLAVGRFVKKKGFEYLLKAMKTVSEKKSNVRLVLIGDGTLRDELSQLVGSLGIDSFVSFVGIVQRERIVEYYNLADIMVSPSVIDEKGNVDGGPTVVLESMACGKPQVLTNILGMAKYVKNDVGGYVVAQRSSKALSRAILKLASSSVLRNRMGKVNRKTAVDELNPRKIGLEYTRLFKDITK